MAMYQRFVAVLLVIISLTPLCLGEPKLVSQRAAFYGGFFYPAGQGNCPTHLTNCDPNGSNDGTGAVCCPSNTVCQGQFENNGGWWRYFCCPDSVDCSPAVNAAPTCADPSWGLYLDDNGHYFCCLPGQIGIDGQSCAAADIPAATSTLATSETNANTASPTGTGQAASATVTEAGGSKSAAATTTVSTTSTATKSGVGAVISGIEGKNNANSNMIAGGFLASCIAVLAFVFSF